MDLSKHMLFHSVWMVGTVGIEPLLWGMKRNAAESRSSESHLSRGYSLEDSRL